MNMSSDISTG